jgi:hypothetical protein
MAPAQCGFGDHPQRLFFGFEYRGQQLAVVALDGTGRVCLQVCFPLPAPHDDDLAAAPAALIATTLAAFVRSHAAVAVCGVDERFAAVAALARHLDGPVHRVSDLELSRWDGLGALGQLRHDPRVEAQLRALLAALAVAAEQPA